MPQIFFWGPLHLQYAFKPSFIVANDEQDFDKKLEALRCYESQVAARIWLERMEEPPERPGDLRAVQGRFFRVDLDPGVELSEIVGPGAVTHRSGTARFLADSSFS